MALAIVFMLVFGTVLARMTPALGTLWLYPLHKSIGLGLLALVLLRLVWHRISPPPASLTTGIPRWQQRAARAAHAGLYTLMIAAPLSGWIGSAATGITVSFFGLGPLPQIVPASEWLDSAGFLAHAILTKALFALVILHVAAALHRHFSFRDRTLRRMLGWPAPHR